MRLSTQTLRAVAVSGLLSAAAALIVQAADTPAQQKARIALRQKIAELEGRAPELPPVSVAPATTPAVPVVTQRAPATAGTPRASGKVDIERARSTVREKVAELEGAGTRTTTGRVPRPESSVSAQTPQVRTDATASPAVVSAPAATGSVGASELEKARATARQKATELEKPGTAALPAQQVTAGSTSTEPAFVADPAAIERARTVVRQKQAELEKFSPMPARTPEAVPPAAIQAARTAAREKVAETERVWGQPAESKSVFVADPAAIERARALARQKQVELDQTSFPQEIAVPRVDPARLRQAQELVRRKASELEFEPVQLRVPATNAAAVDRARQQVRERVAGLERKPSVQDTEKLKEQAKKEAVQKATMPAAASTTKTKKEVKQQPQTQAATRAPEPKPTPTAKPTPTSKETKEKAAQSVKKQVAPVQAKPEQGAAAMGKKQVAPESKRPVKPEPTAKPQPQKAASTEKATPQAPAAAPSKRATPGQPPRQQAEKAAQKQAETKPKPQSPATAPQAGKPGASGDLNMPADLSKGMEVPPPPVSPEKQAKLKALLDRYLADQITPEEYHRERARILAEP